MYYITNHNNQIIAADESLLKSLQLEDIDDLIKKVLLEEISFKNNSSTELQITASTDTHLYSMNRLSLSSMLGSLHLIHLEMLEKDKDLLEFDNEILPVKEEVDNTEELFSLSVDNEVLSSDDIDLSENNGVSDSKLFDLTLPSVATNTLDEITSNNEEEKESLPLSSVEISKQSESLDTSPIIINIKEVSADIGISNEDYRTFLNDYIDIAISLKEELQSKDENERLYAVETLTQLAGVLQLPKVTTIIQQISTIPENELPDLVESFYQTLSRLITKDENIHNETKIYDGLTLNTKESKETDFETKTIPINGISGFGKIYLEDVKPIHFDFQLESAANDLSLPVELIEEFVLDFIEQGHSETKKMLQAYEEGDLDTIQKIGHLLKGASSNLRINALSDTLYDIQFCEDSDKLEGLIERYWAHFISFEQQINMITK